MLISGTKVLSCMQECLRVEYFLQFLVGKLTVVTFRVSSSNTRRMTLILFLCVLESAGSSISLWICTAMVVDLECYHGIIRCLNVLFCRSMLLRSALLGVLVYFWYRKVALRTDLSTVRFFSFFFYLTTFAEFLKIFWFLSPGIENI